MFREMRRKRQLLADSESIEILNRGTSGVLALSGDDDYPYAVPLSYVYDDSKIYFHSAAAGHKIDALKKCGKASFCVIDRDNIIPEKYTTYYRSVIAFGKIRIMKDEEEIKKAVERLAVKYYPEDSEAHRNEIINKELKALCMLEFSVKHLTGKGTVSQ